MTDKPTPKEMDDLFVEETGFATDDFPAAIFDFARAVLAKWGQPAQAQAVAVPLTCEWTHNEDDGFWETACGEAWRFDDGGPGENNMHFCHSCGNSLRIKGGQHVS